MSIWIFSGVLGFLGLLFAGSGLARMKQKPVAGGGGAIFGSALAGVALILGLVGLNLRTYDRLTFEQYVAQITFDQAGPQEFTATIRTPDGEEAAYDVKGDDWQVDARVLKFPPWANMAGLDSVYRLDRLAGRYHDIDAELNDPRTVYALSENPGVDVWKLARGRGQALNIDTSFGSGVYHPMADGAVFEIRLTQSALVSRPINAQAEAAVRGWDGRQPPPPIAESNPAD